MLPIMVLSISKIMMNGCFFIVPIVIHSSIIRIYKTYKNKAPIKHIKTSHL